MRRLTPAPSTAILLRLTRGRRSAPSLAEVIIPLRSHDEAILVLGPYDRYAKLMRQLLDIELDDFGYQFYMGAEERADPLEKLRTTVEEMRLTEGQRQD